MGIEVRGVAPPSGEVPMVEAEAVRQMRDLVARGWGSKRIARELGLARNTVRRYLRGGAGAEVQGRHASRRLDESARTEAVSIFETAAEGNAVVVARVLAERGVEASLRTVQRAVAERRRDLRAAELEGRNVFEFRPSFHQRRDLVEAVKELGVRGLLDPECPSWSKVAMRSSTGTWDSSCPWWFGRSRGWLSSLGLHSTTAMDQSEAEQTPSKLQRTPLAAR
jgi:hypothetical protein